MEPVELEEELAEVDELVSEPVAAAPPCGPLLLEAADPAEAKLVSAGPVDPNTAVLETRPVDRVLVTRVLRWPVEVSGLELNKVVAGDRTKVPLVYENCRVDVAVTVMVDSELVIVLLLLVAEDRAVRAVARVSVKVEDAKEVSDGSGVVGGVEVMMAWEESSALVVTAEVSVGKLRFSASTVSVPKEETETRTSLVAAATIVASSVVEPTSTLTSTTLAVTVASGTRGRRWTPAFRRTSWGLSRETSRCVPRCMSTRAMVRLGAWKSTPSASSLRVPSSDVKSPSFILEPASRGDLESGLEIFSLFAGGFMLLSRPEHRKQYDEELWWRLTRRPLVVIRVYQGASGF